MACKVHNSTDARLFRQQVFWTPSPRSEQTDGSEGFEIEPKSEWRTLYIDEIVIVAKNQQLVFSYVLSTMTSLDLSRNQLDGDIPTELLDLQGLVFLNLSDNHLRGGIPKGLANLTALESLGLSTNQLNGSIPSELAMGLTLLITLYLSQNLLSGPIPHINQFDTFPASSYGGNVGLYGPLLSVNCSSPNFGDYAPTATSSSHESFVEEWGFVSGTWRGGRHWLYCVFEFLIAKGLCLW